MPKLNFDVAIKLQNGKHKHKVFKNNQKDFNHLCNGSIHLVKLSLRDGSHQYLSRSFGRFSVPTAKSPLA
ncbi:hypothetical protein [Glaesserella parasuis]|uniref:hypothetical protein n=1 Tax=Glaesserella parasuis TaxID=738 RepID=UPI001F436F50|nr:hypothetical protein [Glaesserella parasuis]